MKMDARLILRKDSYKAMDDKPKTLQKQHFSKNRQKERGPESIFTKTTGKQSYTAVQAKNSNKNQEEMFSKTLPKFAGNL